MASLHVAILAATLFIAPVPSLVAERFNYTWALLLFALPSAEILFWFFVTPRSELRRVRGALLLTLGLLIPLGVLLNLVFAADFFVYENPAAVLGWYVPGLDLHGLDRAHPIPVEEFAFYALGFLAMLLLYLWGDESFLSRYGVDDERVQATRIGPVIRLAWEPALVAALLLGAGILYKQLAGDGGFPGYLAYLLAIPFVLTFALYRVARPLINWQAFALMLVMILGISVLWEVSLAIPQKWWGYRSPAMVGLFIRPWHDLPFEAVIVWFLAAFATVVTFEAAKVFLHHAEPALARRLFAKAPRPVSIPTPTPVLPVE